MTKKHGSKFSAVVAPSDATAKNRNIGAQQLPFVLLTMLKKILENLLPVWLLVRTNLFIPSRFWTTNMKFDNCRVRYI